ncbi:MAG: response regulator [Candidatus Manganitrophus sp.]|nr:response regulator [Candidatus Manganitrophus sp.]
MKEALLKKRWDVILADYFMPRFDALKAMRLMKDAGLDLLHRIISGSIGEEIAVAAMKAGAHDYMMKDNLSRLSPAIERERQEAVRRGEHRQASSPFSRVKTLPTVGREHRTSFLDEDFRDQQGNVC